MLLVLAVLLPLEGFAFCTGDFDADGDVDGWNLYQLASGRKGLTASFFAADFGRTACPSLPAAPLNQFTIGDSIGEGEAADNTIGEMHHEAVWSTGYTAPYIVNSLNVRFEGGEPVGYFENNSARDATFNQAESGGGRGGRRSRSRCGRHGVGLARQQRRVLGAQYRNAPGGSHEGPVQAAVPRRTGCSGGIAGDARCVHPRVGYSSHLLALDCQAFETVVSLHLVIAIFPLPDPSRQSIGE